MEILNGNGDIKGIPSNCTDSNVGIPIAQAIACAQCVERAMSGQAGAKLSQAAALHRRQLTTNTFPPRFGDSPDGYNATDALAVLETALLAAVSHFGNKVRPTVHNHSGHVPRIGVTKFRPPPERRPRLGVAPR